MRVVLELAGVRNCFGKQLGSANPLNNARATIEGLRALRTFKQVGSQSCFKTPVGVHQGAQEPMHGADSAVTRTKPRGALPCCHAS